MRIQKRLALRTFLATLIVIVFMLAMTTFPVSALTINTTVSGGSATVYSNLQEITNPLALNNGTTYLLSPIPLAGTSVTALPEGSALLKATATVNAGSTYVTGDGFTMNPNGHHMEVVKAGDSFDQCEKGAVWHGTISGANAFDGMTGNTGTGWYYWCAGGSVHAAGPFYCYFYTTATHSPVIQLNNNFQADTTKITKSMLNITIGSIPVSEFTLTEADVNPGVDNTFCISHDGITYTCTIPTATVTYQTLGGGASMPSKATVWQGFPVTLANVYNANQTFEGWYTIGNTPVGTGGDSYTPPGDITLFAQYSDYDTALFVDPDGTLYGFSSGVRGDVIADPVVIPPTKTGYALNGFKTAGGQLYDPGNTAFNGNAVYIADWQAKTYYIIKDTATTYIVTDTQPGGGTYTSAPFDSTVALDVPVKAGYTFLGWVDSLGRLFSNPDNVSTVSYKISGPDQLEARFIEDLASYQLVRFIDQDTNQLYGHYYRHAGETSIVAPAAPSKAGYHFVQWVNSANSSDTLNPGDPVSFSNTATGTTDYYAQWEGIEQQLIYSGTLGSSSHVNSAFDSANAGVQFFIGDTITFDCTGTATASDTDNIVPEDRYRIAALHISYTDINGVAQNVTLFPDANGICSFNVPLASNDKIFYYAEAVQSEFAISDQTGAHLSATAYVDGNAANIAEAGTLVNVEFSADSGYVLDAGTILITCGSHTLTYAKVTDGTTTYYQFMMPAGDVEIRAEAKYDAHQISLVTTNATIAPLHNATENAPITAGVTPVPAGNTVNFGVTADAGYTVTGVNVLDTGSNQYIPVVFDPNNGVYTFTMPSANVKISAVAERNKASLVILDHDNTLLGIEVVTEGNTVTVAADGTISIGANTYTPSNLDGYTFKEWQRTADNTQFNSHTAISGYFIVKPVYDANGYNMKLGADSSDVATIKVTYPNHTGVTLDTTGTTVKTGDHVTVTATPDPNYQITGIAVRAADGSTTVVETRLVSKDPVTGAWTYNFVMPAYAVEVSAYTEAIPYHVTVTEHAYPEGGTYTINGTVTDNAYIKQGSNVSIPVTPERGYRISGITVSYLLNGGNTVYVRDINGTLYNESYNPNTENPYTINFKMPQADVAVDITYEKVNYTFTTTCVENTWGSINGLPATANVGDLIDFTVTAGYGYNLKTLTIKYGAIVITPVVTANPVVNGDGTTTYYYQFTMPASNVDLVATFVKNQYTVTFVDYDGKTLETQTVNYLDKPAVPNIIPTRTGYHFTGWTKATTLENPGYGNPFVSDVFNTTQATVIYATYQVDTYNIEYVFDSAKGTVTGPANANYNAEVTASVTPALGYQINTVTATYLDLNNVKQSIIFTGTPSDLEAGGNYTFTMPALKANTKVTFTTTFTEITRSAYLANVNYAVVTLNGLNAEDYHIDAKFNSTVTIKVTPDAGYKLSALTVTKRGEATTMVKDFASTLAAAGGSYTFTMPAYDVDVNVTIVPIEYTITYNTPANGTITDKTTAAAYKSIAEFKVTPAQGYQIKSVRAYYTDDNSLDQDITFTSKPTDMIAGGVYKFVMPMANVNVVVEFEEITYKVVIGNVIGNGEVRLNSTDTANIAADFGETVTITATPKDGWYLKTLTVTNDTTQTAVTYSPALAAAGGDYTFTMPASNVTVSVEFAKITYNISTDITYAGYGAITVASTASEGDKVDFTVTPNYGYKIKSVYVKDAGGRAVALTDSAYTFTMPAKNVTVYAIFEKIDYTVVFKDYDGKVLKSEAVPYLNSATAPAAPTREGYTFIGWDQDFSSVTQNMVIIAQYKINTPTVTVASTANGDTTVDKLTPDYNATVTVTADPADGYRFKSVSVVTAEGKAVPYTFVKEALNYVTTYKFTMPDDNVIVTVTYSENVSSSYTDVRSDDWFYHAVTFVSDRNYFKGYGEDIFAPYDNMTRAMFVTVLGRLSQADTSLYTVSTFNDVAVNTWYGPYVAWANQNSVILGYGDNDGDGKPEFGPEDNITREQMAAIMYRYAIACGYDTSEKNQDWMTKFSDSSRSHDYASDAIAWCVGNGIIHGYDLSPTETVIDPLGYASRAQVAQVIQNFVDKLIYK